MNEAVKNIKDEIRRRFEEAKKEIEALGGWEGFKKGEWFLKLIQRSFKSYYDNANAEYFRKKYPKASDAELIKRLTAVAAKNASILGGLVGAAVSADEIVAIVTVGEGGLGLPANVTIALTAMAGEIILLTRMQLQLVANIAKIMQIPLSPDDPEDVLTIFGFAAGGAVVEEAGKAGAKIAGHLSKTFIKEHIKKDVLKQIQKIASRIGVKILQRTIIKYTVPGVSIGVGATWNFFSTKAISKIAVKHFHARLKDIHGNPE